MYDITLPEVCAVELPSGTARVFVRRGVVGYFEKLRGYDPATYNELHGVTKAQEQAMLCGSMFGWECPAAQAANYDESGKFIRKAG